jgi:outer membrane protein, heavy metal efflux system
MNVLKLALACVLAIIVSPIKPLGAEPAQQSRPVLSEFIQVITEQHPALAEARARLRAARARARGQARPIYNPEVEVEYENAESDTSFVGLSQSFDWAGKGRSRAETAQAEVNVATAFLEFTRKTLITEVLMALSEYQARLQDHSLNENRVRLGQQFLLVAEARNRAGDLSRSELLTARLALAEAEIGLGEAVSALSASREKLVALSGESRPTWPILSGAPPPQIRPISNFDAGTLPETVLARANTAAFRSRIQRAQSDRMPDPTFGVRYGEEGQSSLLGLRFSIPVPVRNSFRAEVDAARADYLAAEQGENGIFRSTQSRLSASYARYTAAVETWRVWDAGGSEALEEQRALLQTLWQTGEIGAVNYLVQLNQTFDAQQAALDSNARLWGSWFDWLDASATVNEWMETIR